MKDKKNSIWLPATLVILINFAITFVLGALLLWCVDADMTIKNVLSVCIITLLVGKMDYIKLDVKKEI